MTELGAMHADGLHAETSDDQALLAPSSPTGP